MSTTTTTARAEIARTNLENLTPDSSERLALIGELLEQIGYRVETSDIPDDLTGDLLLRLTVTEPALACPYCEQRHTSDPDLEAASGQRIAGWLAALLPAGWTAWYGNTGGSVYCVGIEYQPKDLPRGADPTAVSNFAYILIGDAGGNLGWSTHCNGEEPAAFGDLTGRNGRKFCWGVDEETDRLIVSAALDTLLPEILETDRKLRLWAQAEA